MNNQPIELTNEDLDLVSGGYSIGNNYTFSNTSVEQVSYGNNNTNPTSGNQVLPPGFTFPF
jgi:hypothetical protein